MSLPNNPTFDFALSGVSSNLTLGKGGPRVSSDGTNVQLLNTSGQPGNLTINQGFFANIGIGTAAISYPLDVWGNIHLGNTTTTSGIIFPDGTFQTTAVTSSPPGGSNGWVQFNQNNTFGASQNFVFDNANVRLGIGTSYPSNTLNVWGNLQISNVNGLTSGILFPDGTFQDTATQNTPSFGSVGTIQLAGVNNTFSGDSTHLSWDSAALALNTSNIVISSPSGNITGAYTIAANIFTGNSSTISGNSSVGGNLSVYGNLFVGGVVTFSNIAIEQDLRVNSLTSNTYVQAGTQLLGNTIFSNTTIQSQGLATVNQLIANANVYGANLNIAGLAQVNSLSVNTATSTASLNVGAGGALVNSLISNNNITGATLDILGAAEVNSLISNTTIQSIGTATVNALYSNGIIQAAGNLTVGGVNSNGTIVGSQLASNSSIQAATFLYANEIYSNSYIHAGNTITGNAIKSNTFVHAIGEVVGGSLISNSTIQAAGTAIVNALISNNNVFGTSLQTSGRATVSDLVSNTNITAATLAAYGNVQVGALISNSTIQADGTATVNALVSNTNVFGATLQSSGTSNLANLVVNTNITTQVVNVTAEAWLNDVISNNNITTATLNTTGVAQVNSLISNTSIQAIGGVTVDSLTSNTNVNASSANIANDLYAGSLNVNGTAQANLIISNTGISTQTLTASGLIVGEVINSNTTIQSAGTTTVNQLISNTTVTAGNGLIATAGGLRVTGNTSIAGNAYVSGNLYVAGNIIAVAADQINSTAPIIFVANANPGDVWDLGIVGSYVTDNHYYTGVVRDYINGAWTVYDTGIFKPNITVDWTDPSLTYGGFIAGNINAAGQTASINSETGSIIIYGAGGLGVGGAINAGDQIATTAGLNIGATATVNALISNTSIQATGDAVLGTVTSNSSIQAAGTATVNALVSNTSISADTLQVTNGVVVNSLTSNTFIQSAGLTTTNTFASNGAAYIGGNLLVEGNVLIADPTVSVDQFTGALVVTGGIGAGGNVNIAGAITAGNVNANSASFFGNTETGYGALYAGLPAGYSVLPNDVAQFSGNGNSYVQINLENISSGTNASSDYIATANNGTDTTYYVDLGINGSTYDPIANKQTSQYANDSYLISVGNANTAGYNGGNLVIGTATPDTVVRLVAGGLMADNVIATFGATYIDIAVPLTLESNLQISGNIVVGSLTSNSTIQSAGTTTVNSLVSNTEVGADSVFVRYGQFGTLVTDFIYSNLGIQTDSRVTARWVESNTYVATQAVFANNLQSTGPINGAYIFANVFIQSNGQLIADTINSNNTIQSAGFATVGGLYSNSTIQSISSVTVGSLTSNAAIQAAGSITAQDLRSNSTIVSAGTTTVNALVSNTIIQATGNATVGNLTTSGTITTTGSSGNIIGVNTLFTIDVQSSGNITTQHLISNANVGIGTVIAEYPLDVYGNIHIGNTTPTSGIIFSDGSFQSSAASATKSFGQQYTMQFAGTGNTFSGDSSNLLWDAANLSLFTSNISVHDSASIGGAINLSGNLNGSNTTIVTAKTGTFIGGLNGFGAIYAGLQDWTNYQPNTVALFTGNANAQAQINVHNESNGGSASTDIVATANNGTATDTYIDLGINSSGYNQATIDRANDGYLFVHGNAITGGGNLVLGTVSNNDIIFVQGGATAGNEVARFAYGLGLRIESNLSVSNAAVFDNNITVAANSTFFSNLSVNGNLLTLGNAIFQNNISAYSASIGSFDQINSRGIANVQILHSNGYVSGNTWVVDGNAHTSTSSTQQIVDSWPTASFRTAHYMLQITDNTSAAYQASQIMLLQDGTDVYLTEYADIYTATSLGSWSADISNGIVELLFTPNTSDNMNIKVVRTNIDL